MSSSAPVCSRPMVGAIPAVWSVREKLQGPNGCMVHGIYGTLYMKNIYIYILVLKYLFTNMMCIVIGRYYEGQSWGSSLIGCFNSLISFGKSNNNT